MVNEAEQQNRAAELKALEPGRKSGKEKEIGKKRKPVNVCE